MKYYNICNKYGKIAIKAVNENHALTKYCGYNGLLCIPSSWFVEEITKDDYDKAYRKID